MGLNKNHLVPRAKGDDNLMGLRKEIDRRVVDMILNTLTPHQRELLRRTAGNPKIEFHLRKLIEALLNAELVMGASLDSEFRESLTLAQGENSVSLGGKDE